MCVPDTEAAFRSLYARDGRATLRRPGRLIPEDRRDILFFIGPGENWQHLLRRGLDAALERRAGHTHGSDTATLARQYRASGRWNHGVARPRFHSGLNRYPDPLRHSAGLFAHAEVRLRRA